MDKNIEIEIHEEEFEEGFNAQLPTNFLSFGEIESDDVKVYIKQDVYKALEKYASSDTSKELGTILIGDYCEQLGKTYVVISDYIEAKYTDASASTLTFTHETWDYVHKQHDLLYPDKKIIGWQHTHPNYGIFLSNYDLFIQDNFFNMPFQVAYVIDPIQSIRGFFQWKGGKTEKLKGYYIYDDIGKPIKIECINKGSTVVTKIPKSRNILIDLLCIAVILLSFSVISVNKRYKVQIELQKELLGQIEYQNIEFENQKVAIKAQEKAIEELKEQTSHTESVKGISFIKYTVEEGDNLYRICQKKNIDYGQNIRIIIAVNGIADVTRLYVGQELLIPIID